MADFPTLTYKPVLPIKERFKDSTIRSPKEAGYVETRPRYTRNIEAFGPFKYELMPAADKTTLKDFENNTAKMGAVSFNWTHPDSTVYEVRFAKPVEYNFVLHTGLWEFTVELEVV